MLKQAIRAVAINQNRTGLCGIMHENSEVIKQEGLGALALPERISLCLYIDEVAVEMPVFIFLLGDAALKPCPDAPLGSG